MIAAVAPKIVGISEVRQDATRLIAYAHRKHEPVLICVRSKKAAYLVDATLFEELQAELQRLRHDLFWHGVAEAEQEYREGKAPIHESADELIAELGLAE